LGGGIDLQRYMDALDASLLSASVRSGFRYWRDLLRADAGGGRRMPARRGIDPVAIGRGLLRVTLLDVTYDPLDFRVRLAGEYVRAVQRAQPGRRVADTVGEAQGRDNILRRCAMCAERGLPIRGLYQFVPLARPELVNWGEAVSCPLSDDGATVHNIVVFGCDADFEVPPGTSELP
jgi:hypothetical protein